MLQIFYQIFEKKCENKHSMWCLSHIYDYDYSFQCMLLMTGMSPKESMSQILTKVQTLLHTRHQVWCPSFHEKRNFEAVPKTTLGGAPYVGHVNQSTFDTLGKLLRVIPYHFK